MDKNNLQEGCYYKVAVIGYSRNGEVGKLISRKDACPSTTIRGYNPSIYLKFSDGTEDWFFSTNLELVMNDGN